MYETVTIDEAMKKGSKMITYPLFIIFIVIVGLSFYIGIENILPGWIIAVGFAVGIISAWLYWSIMITKWRLWAFDNVRNVHELKKRAIRANLIGKDNSFPEKTEIRTADDKEKWEALQAKFAQDDIFTDDLTVPDETVVYFSKKQALFGALLGVGMVALGIFLFKGNEITAVILFGVGLFTMYNQYKEYKNTDPQVTLNNEGIESAGTSFFNWKDISDEDVDVVSSGKSSTSYLVYYCPSGNVRLNISDFTTSTSELRHLLDVYRGRANKKQSSGVRQSNLGQG
ncbi:MAG TPA: hypothetical protein VK559_03220 [Ferruginibacter sp.]|nr:hypothetical protein [Ferruginibacter sp.]